MPQPVLSCLIIMKTVRFYTLGCKVNQYDTQKIREQFQNAGFRELDKGRPADVYVVNTCTVTGRADSDSLNYIRRAKRENPDALLVVTGCLAELDSKKIKQIKGVDLIVKNDKKDNIIGLIQGQPPPVTVPVSGISSFKGHTRAFLKVQDGCNNFCSYCKVPLVRGRSRSKVAAEVVREAEALVNNGFKEIVLTGICLGAYGRDLEPKSDLTKLLAALEGVHGLLRIRLSSIEAGDITNGLLKLMASSKKVCRHLHIPLQSGDDTILKRMNRKYSREGYLSLVRKIKKEIPDVSVSIDVLVGFPGEDNRMFLNTAQLIKRIAPLKVHIFPYSERKGTKAAGLPQKLDPRVIRQRIEMLKLISEECSLRFKNKFFNKKMRVLVEGRVKGNHFLWEGYTDNYLPVNLCSKRQLQNQMVLAKCTGINQNYNLNSVIIDNK